MGDSELLFADIISFSEDCGALHERKLLQEHLFLRKMKYATFNVVNCTFSYETFYVRNHLYSFAMLRMNVSQSL